MQFDPYIRIPFNVEALEITDENIAEVAKLIGTLKVKDGEKYIQIDRRVVPNMNRATVGWFVTKVDGNFRVYMPHVFEAQFMAYQAVVSFSMTLPEPDEVLEELPQPAEA